MLNKVVNKVLDMIRAEPAVFFEFFYCHAAGKVAGTEQINSNPVYVHYSYRKTRCSETMSLEVESLMDLRAAALICVTILSRTYGEPVPITNRYSEPIATHVTQKNRFYQNLSRTGFRWLQPIGPLAPLVVLAYWQNPRH